MPDGYVNVRVPYWLAHTTNRTHMVVNDGKYLRTMCGYYFLPADFAPGRWEWGDTDLPACKTCEQKGIF